MFMKLACLLVLLRPIFEIDFCLSLTISVLKFPWHKTLLCLQFIPFLHVDNWTFFPVILANIQC